MYANHKIQKLSVEVNFSGEGTETSYVGWQQVVYDWIEQLKYSFDNASGADKVIQIDHLKLEIDVLEADWKFDAGLQLKAKVLDILSKHRDPNDISLKIKSETLEENDFSQFMFFLENGFFTWNVSAERQQKILDNWIEIVATSSGFLRQKLREWLHTKPDAVLRLVALRDFIGWMGVQVSASKNYLDAHIKYIRHFILDEQTYFSTALQRENLYSIWVLNLYANVDILLPIPQHLSIGMRIVEVQSPDIWSTAFGTYLSNLPEGCKPYWIIQFTQAAFNHSIRKAGEEWIKESTSDGLIVNQLSKEDDELLKAQQQHIAAWRNRLAAGENYSGIQVSAIIGNAGLVILAPFLPAFFQKVGLITDNGKLANFSLAVGLLHYIAHPVGKMQEQQQLLPKLLCGQAPDVYFEPLSFTKITIFKAEIDSLLGAVIEYWGALKNTSIEGLRESFLQREGRLIRVDEQWQLKVETKAYDLLLGYLPWTISIIKLPWMKELIKVEWHAT
jgi:hypothetical protein